MGMGDELIAAGQARHMRKIDPDHRRVMILDAFRRPRWNLMWEGNPDIARPEEQGNFQQLVNAGNARPYTLAKTEQRWTWKPHECMPAQIVFNEGERTFASSKFPGVVIEPNIKAKASPNKAWGFERWVEFVKLANQAGVTVTQLGPAGIQFVPGARWIPTPDFRHGCAVLANARGYVGHEGGLHHAAAALGIPAVVIFGGFISPDQTGYKTHRNLFTGGTACGMRTPCTHCDEAMAAISPQRVFDEMIAALA